MILLSYMVAIFGLGLTVVTPFKFSKGLTNESSGFPRRIVTASQAVAVLGDDSDFRLGTQTRPEVEKTAVLA